MELRALAVVIVAVLIVAAGLVLLGVRANDREVAAFAKSCAEKAFTAEQCAFLIAEKRRNLENEAAMGLAAGMAIGLSVRK